MPTKTAGAMPAQDPFLVEWQNIADRKGVILQSWGSGMPFIIIPGLEGSGESCLHLVIPATEALAEKGMPLQVVLVNYAHEAHETLDELIETIDNLLWDTFGKQEVLMFSQSFGNLISARIAVKKELLIRKMFMVSPFTKLPGLMVRLAAFSMNFTPTSLYRASIKPMAGYVFGPLGAGAARHPFLNALQKATSSQVKRQTSWLKGLDYAGVYEQISVPVKIVLGKKDKLVNIRQQIHFFESLCSRSNNKSLHIVQDFGHVLLPQQATEKGKAQLVKYFSSTN